MTNYFNLFELPLSLDVDQSALTKKYYALNKAFHPDKFSLADAAQQSEALLKSTQINEGYKTLKKKQSRIRHILDLLGAAPSEGNEAMPQDFLMEMMDVNEAIMEYKMDPSEEARAKVSTDLTQFEAGLESQLSELAETFNFESPETAQLSTLKDYYLKSKYLKRLKDNLQDKAAEI